MPAPTNVPEWNSGGTNRTEPPGGVKVSGFAVNGAVSSSFLNWLLFTIYQWVLYLQNLTAEALTWTALQTFRRVNVEGVTTGLGSDLFVSSARTGNASSAITAVMPTTSAGRGVVGFGHIGIRGDNDPANVTTGGAGVSGECSAFDAVGVEGRAVGAGIAGVFGEHTGGGQGVRGVTSGGTLAAGVYGQGPERGVEGATTNLTAGSGGRFAGGAQGVEGLAYAGSNGVGVRGTGNGSGHGVVGAGGANGGAGVLGTGGGPNGDGGRFNGVGAGSGVVGVGGTASAAFGGVFTRGDALTNAPAAKIEGALDFSVATAPAGNVNVSRQFHAKHAVRAWGSIALNGTSAPGFNDRIGVQSVTQDAAGVVTVTLAQAMASVNWTLEAVWVGGSSARIARGLATSATTATIVLFNPTAPGTVLNQASSSGETVFFKAWGEQ